jgi:hypothetical protein
MLKGVEAVIVPHHHVEISVALLTRLVQEIPGEGVKVVTGVPLEERLLPKQLMLIRKMLMELRCSSLEH